MTRTCRRHNRHHSRRHRLRGGGYQTSQQFFDPTAFPPSTMFAAPVSTEANAAMIRPILPSSFKVQSGGSQTSQQFFDPASFPPSASAGIFGSGAAPSTAPTATEVRPVLLSTFPAAAAQMGGRRRRAATRRMSGGFSPSVMGGFVANAQTVAVPLVLYLAYHTMVPKKGNNKTRRASRK